ncbi:Uma2 family endonuclease [Bacillus sp. REN16]|uniref:Uma2 family endonuclease n=1 Tax=Bacillus sp. REN16 TaxID=2887296 RepID=UPI001E510654|nr:Uma2 family endonuclease [Bacillus sp. REN16]MCC3357879.1 Uma2 family endonuclease [Bacillus sp. REN16]
METPNKANSYSISDWLNWEGHWELINGKAYNMTPAPSWDHQFIVGEVHFMLRSYFGNKDCYVAVFPFDVFLSEEEDYENPSHVLQPDISVICNKNQLSTKGCNGAPNLIIEVLSPSTAIKDRNEKFKIYQQFGVQEYWIIDPNYKLIEVYGLDKGYFRIKEVYGQKDELKSFIFPNLKVKLETIFNK